MGKQGKVYKKGVREKVFMMKNRDLQYWIELWEQEKQDGVACNLFWDKKAKSYSEDKAKKNEEINPTVKLLQDRDILKKDSSVLDIGCGPGTHAIDMARECKEVVAIDISGEMLQYLEKNTEKAGLNNIKSYKSNWEDANLSDYKWEKKFDLVFANMTPGIYNYSTFKKMLEASRDYCYFRGFLQRENQLWDALDREILGEGFSNKGIGDKMYYALNVLWNLGHYPEIVYGYSEWEEVRPLEEMIDLYKRKLEIYHEIKKEDQRKIENFFTFHEKDGVVVEKTRSKSAAFIWQV